MNSDHSTTGTTSTGKQIDYKGESQKLMVITSMIKSNLFQELQQIMKTYNLVGKKTYYDRYCMKAYTYYSKGVQVLLQGQMQQIIKYIIIHLVMKENHIHLVEKLDT